MTAAAAAALFAGGVADVASSLGQTRAEGEIGDVGGLFAGGFNDTDVTEALLVEPNELCLANNSLDMNNHQNLDVSMLGMPANANATGPIDCNNTFQEDTLPQTMFELAPL